MNRRRHRLIKLRKAGAALIAAVAVLLAISAPAAAYPRPGATERVSVSSDGAEADGGTGLLAQTAISPDGRYVAFYSQATNLVPGDTNGFQDVFVHDQQEGTTERVSVSSDGAEGNGTSNRPSISADGRFVAFDSFASNLVPGDTNGTFDVFVHDRAAGVTERVSVSSDGAGGNTVSYAPSITPDGRYVAFISRATNLVPGDTTDFFDVFVHDRQEGTTERVSVSSDGAEGNEHSGSGNFGNNVTQTATIISNPPTISADGRYVAFVSGATNLVPGDTNDQDDAFVHDRETGTTGRVSVSSAGAEGNSRSLGPAISGDGRYVAFWSTASNLVPGDTNFQAFLGSQQRVESAADVFVHDRETGTTGRVSVSSAGAEGNGRSLALAISADGRYVAFESFASNLVPGDTNGFQDVFVHDRQTRETDRVSVSSEGAQGNVWSVKPAISADGRYVAFWSAADNLVPDASPNQTDVYVRDRGEAARPGDLSLTVAPDKIDVAGWTRFPAASVADVTDPDDDGGSVGPLTARDLGAELIGAELVQRPEDEDILLRLHLAALPGLVHGKCVAAPASCAAASTGAGSPGIRYALGFDLDGTRHEIRALRAAATASPPAAPYFALVRCDPSCTETARLQGGIGTTGNEIRVSIPLEDLGITEGDVLSGLQAFTAVGEATAWVQRLDEAALPDATLGVTSVMLGIAPAGMTPQTVDFSTPAQVTEGRFYGTLDVSGLPGGRYDVWTRACLADECGAASVSVNR